jgi:hypothetical protein
MWSKDKYIKTYDNAQAVNVISFIRRYLSVISESKTLTELDKMFGTTFIEREFAKEYVKAANKIK